VPGVAVGDLDGSVLTRFRERAARTKRLGVDALAEDDAGLIEKLRLAEDRYLKRAAVLLFHADPERFFSGASVKIGYFEREADLRFHDEVHGGLFAQVSTTMDLLLTKYLKAGISYEGIQRVETYPVPQSALREIVLNAVVHRDYAVAAPIQIRVFPDRLRIWNPGELPESWSVKKLLGPHASRPFNPDVANTFFRAGEIEAWGRGVHRVFEACRIEHPVSLDTRLG
jgi:ATP-dependent DNA helicase RecG